MALDARRSIGPAHRRLAAAGVLALLYTTVGMTVISGLDIAWAMRRRAPTWSTAAS